MFMPSLHSLFLELTLLLQSFLRWIELNVHRINFNGAGNSRHNYGGGFFIANVILDNKSGPFACLFAFSGRIPSLQATPPHVQENPSR